MLHKVRFTVLLALVGLLLIVAFSPIEAQTSPLPVSQTGPYQVGVRALLLKDPSRNDRSLQAFIWFPAVIAKDAKPPFPPDTSGGKYPLIIYSHGYGAAVTEAVGTIQYLVSRGFVVAGVNHGDPATDKWLAFVNRPLDVLFLLNQLAALKNDPLSSIMDTDNVGIWGHSMGAYTAVSLSGARVDPTHLKDWCPTYVDDPDYKFNFDSCNLLTSWDKLLGYHDQFDPPSTNALWAATTDDRIKAIFGVAPCFGQMYGADGLAAATLPAFIVGGTVDHTCPYAIDASYIYQHLGSADRYLVSLKDRDHAGSFSEPNLISSYTAAFFGYYLQGITDYAKDMTPDTADAYKDVTLEATLGSK